jgi:hypothetical protein
MAYHKVSKHLWYLMAELTPFALVSDKVTAGEKREIANTIFKHIGGTPRLGHPQMKPFTKDSTLASRIDANTLFLFQQLQIDLGKFHDQVDNGYSQTKAHSTLCPAGSHLLFAGQFQILSY